MATTPSPTYRAYQAPTTGSRFGYSNESDPRKLAANQRSVVQSTGDNLQNADQQLADQYGQQASGVEQYLDPIQSNLAAGNGGYSPDEANQIQLSQADKNQIEWSPSDVQNLVNKAGISAGQQTAASVGGAERAAAAGGGSPAALATYRARAAQTGAVNAADAETNARVAAKQAQGAGAATAQQLQSAGGQAVGGARIGQQNEGLGYYGGLQQEKNSNSLNEQGLQQGAFGTQTQGTGQAAGLGYQASQTPTTTDKIIGGVAGAASAFLADGESGYLDPEGQNAVVGENGMEAVINNAPAAVQRGASDPVRSDTTFMDGGYAGDGSEPGEMGDTSGTGFGVDSLDPSSIQENAVRNPNKPNFLQNYLSQMRQRQQQPTGTAGQQWNKTTPYQQLGSAVGKLATSAILGSGAGGIGGEMMADGESGYLSTDEGVSMMEDGVQSPEDYHRQADAALQREHKNEGPGKGGAQYSDHDTYTSMANMAAVPAKGWGSDLAGAGKSPLRSGPYTRTLPSGPGRGGQPHMADGHMPNGIQVGRAQVFTRPTAVRLDKADSVVPLTYRPKAKVRPSAALPALGARNAA